MPPQGARKGRWDVSSEIQKDSGVLSSEDSEAGRNGGWGPEGGMGPRWPRLGHRQNLSAGDRWRLSESGISRGLTDQPHPVLSDGVISGSESPLTSTGILKGSRAAPRPKQAPARGERRKGLQSDPEPRWVLASRAASRRQRDGGGEPTRGPPEHSGHTCPRAPDGQQGPAASPLPLQPERRLGRDAGAPSKPPHKVFYVVICVQQSLGVSHSAPWVLGTNRTGRPQAEPGRQGRNRLPLHLQTRVSPLVPPPVL